MPETGGRPWDALKAEVSTVDDSFEVAEITDSLETLGVFRLWKNVFLVLIIVSLFATQACFWLLDMGLIGTNVESGMHLPVPGDAKASQHISAEGLPGADGSAGPVGITTNVHQVVKIANGTAILSAILYCLTLQSCMILTAVGGFGGLRHVCRAFFLALVMLVLLLPWQQILGMPVLGTLYGPNELAAGCSSETGRVFVLILHYLRFCGLWMLCLVLLLMSQFRCTQWARSILRRLEIL